MIEELLRKRDGARLFMGPLPVKLNLAVLIDPISEADIVIDKDFTPLPLEKDGAIGTIYGMRVYVIPRAEELCEVVIRP